MGMVVEEDDWKAEISSLLKVLACSKQEYVGTGHDDVPSTGCDDALVLRVVAKIPRHRLRRRAELCLEPGLPLALGGWKS